MPGHEDKLTRQERIRLEALARVQGMAGIAPNDWPTMKQLAEVVEAWLLEANNKVN